MTDPREEQRTWLRAVLEQSGMSAAALAAKAGISGPTITVFLNNPEAKHALSARTVSAIEAATGMRFGPDPRPVGFRQSEAAPWDARRAGTELDFLKSAVEKANGVDPWVLRSRALETAGYMPGDIMVVDLNRDARPGDVVCARLHDWARSRAELVFRLWEPPYLVPATMDASLRKVFPVDNETTVIKGVVTASIRPRAAKAA